MKINSNQINSKINNDIPNVNFNSRIPVKVMVRMQTGASETVAPLQNTNAALTIIKSLMAILNSRNTGEDGRKIIDCFRRMVSDNGLTWGIRVRLHTQGDKATLYTGADSTRLKILKRRWEKARNSVSSAKQKAETEYSRFTGAAPGFRTKIDGSQELQPAELVIYTRGSLPNKGKKVHVSELTIEDIYFRPYHPDTPLTPSPVKLPSAQVSTPKAIQPSTTTTAGAPKKPEKFRFQQLLLAFPFI